MLEIRWNHMSQWNFDLPAGSMKAHQNYNPTQIIPTTRRKAMEIDHTGGTSELHKAMDGGAGGKVFSSCGGLVQEISSVNLGVLSPSGYFKKSG